MKFTAEPTPSIDELESNSIYSPRVRLAYTPPVALPAPFPQTLRIEGVSSDIVISWNDPQIKTGMPLYMASSVFVRHTLNALYSDLQVELRRVDVQRPSSRVTKATERIEMGGKLSR
jgi:hypothetical protein